MAKRKPAQEDQIEPDDATQTEITDGSESESPGDAQAFTKENDPTSGEGSDIANDSSGPAMDQQSALALSRGLAGAAPALMGFLFGASPATVESQLKEQQAYYKAGKPGKLVMTKGPNGEPIYQDASMAVGEQAWQKPGKAAAGASYAPITYKNEQGLEAIGRFNKATGQVEQPTTGAPVENAVKYQAPQYKEVTDEQGNKKIISIGPTSSVKNIATTSKGLGAKYNLREDEVQEGDKYAAKYLQDAKPIYESKTSLKGAMQLLNAPDADALTQSAGIFRTAKAIVNERISDQERGFVTMPPGVLEGLMQKIETIATNKNPQEKLRQLRSVLLELDKTNDMALSSLQDRNVKTYSAGDARKAKYLSDKIVSASDIALEGTRTMKSPLSALSDAQLDKMLDESRARRRKGGK